MNVEESQETEISLVGAHWGTWGVRRLGILETVGGLRKGSISFSVGAVRRALLWGSGRRAPGMDTILLLGVHSPGTLRISCKRGLWERDIPLYGGSFGEPGGRLLCWGP
jgi:hypothetical protein